MWKTTTGDSTARRFLTLLGTLPTNTLTRHKSMRWLGIFHIIYIILIKIINIYKQCLKQTALQPSSRSGKPQLAAPQPAPTFGQSWDSFPLPGLTSSGGEAIPCPPQALH